MGGKGEDKGFEGEKGVWGNGGRAGAPQVTQSGRCNVQIMQGRLVDALHHTTLTGQPTEKPHELESVSP